MGKGWVYAAGMLLVLGGGEVAGGGARAEALSLELSYGVFAKGFKGLDVAADIDIDDDSYTARVDATTTGLVSLFVDWEMQAESSGKFEGMQPVPQLHKTRNQQRDTERWVEIVYAPDGSLALTSVPSTEEDGRPAVPQEAIDGTIDPISALMGALMGTTAGEACPRPMAVFDGRRRYDLSAEKLPDRQFMGSGLAPYAGAAVGCEIVLEQLAGFKETESSNRDVLNSTIKVWLSDVADTGWLLPVRMEMQGRSGRVLIHLQEVRDPGGDVVFGDS